MNMTDKQVLEMVRAFTKDQYHIYEYNHRTRRRNLWASFDSFEEANEEYCKRRKVVLGWKGCWHVLIVRDNSSPML